MLPKHMLRLLTLRNNISTNLVKNSENSAKLPSKFIRNYAKSTSDIDAELNKPVQYTTSPAHDWKAAHSRIGSKAEFGPWYEAHVVSASVIAFMIYFFILREENDLDLMLEKPLSDTLKDV